MDAHAKKAKQLFCEYGIPENVESFAGYSWLMLEYNIDCLRDYKPLAAVNKTQQIDTIAPWLLIPNKSKPKPNLKAHLTFALKNEDLDLRTLRAIFQQNITKELAVWVNSEPTGIYARRSWFLYEWLTGNKLDVPDATTGNYTPVLDNEKYFTVEATPSKRHRIYNNLIGTPDFCPIVRKTALLKNYQQQDLAKQAQKFSKSVGAVVLRRAAAFLLLQDSKASFAIEKEKANLKREERWCKVLAQAGDRRLSIEELERLQHVVIGKNSFIEMGVRTDGGFISTHSPDQQPVPDHISAKPEDLERLLNGLIQTAQQLANSDFDPIIAASIIAFGFVFIHPFEDGNGRIHRYLIHHILAEKNFSDPQLVFPISVAILENLDKYLVALEKYSKPRLDLIEYEATPKGNVDVINQTIDLYRYYDATAQAEFLYECAIQTIQKILPAEILYLQQYDQLKQSINQQFDMPDYKASLLVKLLHQNKGTLSKRKREKEFPQFDQDDVVWLQEEYEDVFTG